MAMDLMVRAVTFSSPWADAILRPVPEEARAPSPKNLDNRTRPPPRALVGGWIAVHTGKKFDRKGLAWLHRTYDYPWGRNDLSAPGLILGAVRLVDWIEGGERPWYFGPSYQGKRNLGWLLADPILFEAPIPMARGWLGCWNLPEDTLSQVVAGIRRGQSRMTHAGVAA